MLVNVTCLRFFCLLGFLMMPHVSEASFQSIIDGLLEKADQDVIADRLMTPVNNNAFDRYSAVLLLDKSNQRAALGLRAVAERYMAMTRSAIKKKQFATARKVLANAIVVNGRTSETNALSQDIRQAEKQAQLARQASPVHTPVIEELKAEQTTFVLNTGDLSQRNNLVTNHLFSLGQRVQETREYVLIYARNDSEGRWIYQQMRKASPAYRLRGDIKRDKNPRVILQEPLD